MEKHIKIQFRFPVEQTTPDTIIIKLREGPPLAHIDEVTARDLRLTDKEYDKATEAANTAAIRAIAIID